MQIPTLLIQPPPPPSPLPFPISSSSSSSSSTITFLRNMFGGDNMDQVLPIAVDDNRFNFTANTMPQLQLFGDFQVRCGGMESLKHMANEQMNAMDIHVKRAAEVEMVGRPHKFHMSLNNAHLREEGGCPLITTQNIVSTGLRLSCEEDEHNSSTTTTTVTTLPLILSLGDNIKSEISKQKEELDNFIRIQEGNMMKGLRELKQWHTLSVLSAIEKGVSKRLWEKETELGNVNRRNKELLERIKQVTMEAQSWHYRARYNESIVGALQNNLRQVMAQGAAGAAPGNECCGDSEVDEAASCTSHSRASAKRQLWCRGCRGKEASMLLWPCRHLCLCFDCENFVDVCPICKSVKASSIQVFLS